MRSVICGIIIKTEDWNLPDGERQFEGHYLVQKLEISRNKECG